MHSHPGRHHTQQHISVKRMFLGQNYGGRVATRRAFWNRRGGKCDKKGCILGKPLLNSRAGIWTLSVSTLAWMVWGTFFRDEVPQIYLKGASFTSATTIAVTRLKHSLTLLTKGGVGLKL